jgi:hypothetical protein
MVANWAFLVRRDSIAALRQRVHELDDDFAQQGLRLQEAGAWPPYSFTPALAASAETDETSRTLPDRKHGARAYDSWPMACTDAVAYRQRPGDRPCCRKPTRARPSL